MDRNLTASVRFGFSTFLAASCINRKYVISVSLSEGSNFTHGFSFTALNNGMTDFKGQFLFTSRDHQLTETVANRIIEITPKGIIDKLMTYDEYLQDERVRAQRIELYNS